MTRTAALLLLLLAGQVHAQAQIGLINIGGRRPQQPQTPQYTPGPQQTDPALIAILQRQADQQAQLIAILIAQRQPILAPVPAPQVLPGAPRVYEGITPAMPGINIQIGQPPPLSPVPAPPILSPVPPAPILSPVPPPPPLTPAPPPPILTPVPPAPRLSEVWQPQRYAIYRPDPRSNR